MRAMAAAVRYLPQRPGFVLVDGNRLPQELDASRARAVVGGDRIVRCISAASVIAKVHRSPASDGCVFVTTFIAMARDSIVP